MKCSEAKILIDSVLDGEASFKEEQILRFHLNGCSDCRRVMLMNQAISKNVKELHEPSPPEDLMDIVKARLKSGNYDKTPLLQKKQFLSSNRWRVAAVIPFAATLFFIYQTMQNEHSGSTYTASPIEAISTPEIQYAPAPVVAYTRPSSISTF